MLTRDPDKASNTSPPPIGAVEADYGSVDHLTALLRNGNFDDLVISMNRDQLESQLQLINAAATVGNLRILPSCFGLEQTHPKAQRLATLIHNVAMEDHLVAKA